MCSMLVAPNDPGSLLCDLRMGFASLATEEVCAEVSQVWAGQAATDGARAVAGHGVLGLSPGGIITR